MKIEDKKDVYLLFSKKKKKMNLQVLAGEW